MYTVGSWFPVMLNLSVVAFVALGIFGYLLYLRNQYDKQSRGGVWGDIWLPNGKSFGALKKPTVDGWLHILKGDYKLSVSKQYCKCGHDSKEHVMVADKKSKTQNVGNLECQVAGCDCKKFELARVVPNVRRTIKYPPRPFLGLKWLQCDVRTESWYLNCPEPITWPDDRQTITALDAYVHTRELTAEQSAAEIAEQEARNRTWFDAMKKLPDKMVLYIGIGANTILMIVLLVQYFSTKGG